MPSNELFYRFYTFLIRRSRVRCSRIYCSLFTGAACGILGIQGLHGFAVYFAQHILMTLPLVLKAGFRTKEYFPNGYAFDLVKKFHNKSTFMGLQV